MTYKIHSSLTLTVPPVKEVVTVDDVKAHSRIFVDDSVIADFIPTARRYIEAIAQRQFITATYEYCLDRFPWQLIELPVPPIQSVTSIHYIDTAGNTQTLDPSVYVVDTRSNPARIVPQFGRIYPVTRPIVNAVTITFIAGYGDDPTDVPPGYKVAICIMVGHLYENREATTTLNLNEIPLGIRNLVAGESFGGYV